MRRLSISNRLCHAEKNIPVSHVSAIHFRTRAARRVAGTYDFGVYPLHVKEEGETLRFYTGLGRPPCTLSYQGGHSFVACENPNAIRLTFSVQGDRAVKLLLRMATLHWSAERAS
jgi:hypothetical protein